MTTIAGGASESAITIGLGDVQWRPLDPGTPDGAQMAPLWGDPDVGPYGALLRVPAGFESPMHRHSGEERIVMIKGTSMHWTEHESPESAPRMTAGDAMVMPAGVNHVSAAAEGEDCIEFITQDGQFDFIIA